MAKTTKKKTAKKTAKKPPKKTTRRRRPATKANDRTSGTHVNHNEEKQLARDIDAAVESLDPGSRSDMKLLCARLDRGFALSGSRKQKLVSRLYAALDKIHESTTTTDRKTRQLKRISDALARLEAIDQADVHLYERLKAGQSEEQQAAHSGGFQVVINVTKPSGGDK